TSSKCSTGSAGTCRRGSSRGGSRFGCTFPMERSGIRTSPGAWPSDRPTRGSSCRTRSGGGAEAGVTMAARQRKDSSERRVAFLGGGRMGEALASGLVRSKARSKGELIVTCRREERAAELAKRLGVQTSLSNPHAVAWAHTVVLTVKPQDMEALLRQLA